MYIFRPEVFILYIVTTVPRASWLTYTCIDHGGDFKIIRMALMNLPPPTYITHMYTYKAVIFLLHLGNDPG